MISLDNRIQAFASLGELLVGIGENTQQNEDQNEILYKLEQAVTSATNKNGWFIEDNVRYMLASIGVSLIKTNIEKWIAPYRETMESRKSCKKVGVVMAGNIPVVGFHDFMSILISGNILSAKLSSDDDKLLPLIGELLTSIEPGFKDMISFTTNQLKGFDAIIATGSNNTSRYFEYYFGSYPNIIRKNRNGIAVLTGNESEEELQKLTDDIFMYYGLGCRNVSHIMIPKEYELTSFLKNCEANKKVNLNHKYFNNYEYNKAIYLVNGNKHYDTGNLLLTENNSFSSPVSVIHYSYYSDIELVNRLLETNTSTVQCVVSTSKEILNAIPPGTSQSPQLWDYADRIDTLKFLTEL